MTSEADADAFVELERSGGQVPTYRPRVRLALGELSAADRAHCETLARRAASAPGPSQAAPRVPDSFQWQLTIRLADRAPAQTLRFTDHDGHPAAWDVLADWLRRHADRG
jgi:hypothetical protein